MSVAQFSVESFSEEEQEVLLACLLAQVSDIHQPLYQFSEEQSALGAEMADRAEASGQTVLELVLRGPLEDIEDMIDFPTEQWEELERFQEELREVVDARFYASRS